MYQGEGKLYSEASQSIDAPANDGEDGGGTSSDCQSNQSESSTDSRGRLSLLETELQARTRDLDRLKFKIDKMKSHQMSSPTTSRREAKPINIKIEVERLRKDKKVMAELLKQSQQELTRKDSINRKLKMENDKITRNMQALQGKLAENGRTQNLLEELNRVRSELSMLTGKTDRLSTPGYQTETSDKDDRGRYIEELVMEKEQLKQCLSAIYFKITPYAVSLQSRSATPPVWTEDVKNSFDQFWEEKVKLQRELEELREQLKSREATSAEPNRTSPECYETTISECSTDSKSDYLSGATIVKVSRPTPPHHDLESEVCRWKEMYQNVYDKYRSAQHTTAYHEKKFRKIYSAIEELTKNVCGEENFQDNVSGYNLTKVMQKLSEEYKQLKESVKKIKHEEQHQTDLQNSIIEAEKLLEEKGRNARTLRNAIGTLQLTSNMETKVASLAETLLLIYNNQLNWLKQLEHNNTLPNSEGEETHSNSPNQCDIDLPLQDDDKVENRLNGGDAMSCSSESNESSTCETQEVIHKQTSSSLNLQQSEAIENRNDVKEAEGSEVANSQEDEPKIENTEASLEENKESHSTEDDKNEETNEGEEGERNEVKEEIVTEEQSKSESENVANSESIEQETGNKVQTESNVCDENQADLETNNSHKEENESMENNGTKDDEIPEDVNKEQENENGNVCDENETDLEANSSHKEESEPMENNGTKDDEIAEDVNKEQENENDNTEENKKGEEKVNGSDETKNDESGTKDDKDDDDMEQSNSTTGGEHENEDGNDKTEERSKDGSKEDDSKKDDSGKADNGDEGNETEQTKSLPPEQSDNEEATEVDESCRNEENTEVTEDTTEDKETTANDNIDKDTSIADETDSKVESELNIEETEEEKSVQETPIEPKTTAEVASGKKAEENEASASSQTSKEINESPNMSENAMSEKGESSEKNIEQDEESVSMQDNDPPVASENGENSHTTNHSVQSVVAEVHSSADTQEYISDKTNQETEPKSENDQVSTIPEAGEGNGEGGNAKDLDKDGKEISETSDGINKDGEVINETNNERNDEGGANDSTEGSGELNKESSEIHEEESNITCTTEGDEKKEENKEKSEADDGNDSVKDEETTEPNNEMKEADDANDSMKEEGETSEANDQSESLALTEVSNDLNTPSNSHSADGAANIKEGNGSDKAISGGREDAQHAPVEEGEDKIIITEEEEEKSEATPCSSVSHSLSTAENKDTIKIIVNPASSEENESNTEDVEQSTADEGPKAEAGESVEETKEYVESKTNEWNVGGSETEMAPVVEEEITKVVIEPKRTIFFSSISAIEKDTANQRRKSEDSLKQSSDEDLNKRIEELETEMSEMLEVKQHHMKVACDLAEKLEEMKKRELDLQDQLSNAETKSSQEVEVLWKEWSGREQSYQDEIAAWKENVEQQNSVLQRLKADLDKAQQMAQIKEDEIAQLRSLEKEKLPEALLERETQTSDQEEDPNNKELQETVDRLRITSEHYQQQLMENRTVVREVKSIIEGSVAQLVTLKAMGTKHMKREYVYRNNLAQKEIDLKHMQSELDKQSIDVRAKTNIIEKQRNEIRSLREELRKCQKDISAKVEFINELQGKMQKLISSESEPNGANPEDLELYGIGRHCIDEQHTIQLEKQKEELERMRQELHLLEMKCSDVDSAAESSDQQNLSHPGSAGSVGSVSEELPSGSNLCLCKRKDLHKILKLSEESYLNLLASLVVCLGIQDMKYNKSLQRLSWSQCKDISAERKAYQKKIMKVIQELKKEERTVSPRLHHPERSRSTGETEKRRGVVKCISPQNGRSMYISDMIRQAEENLDKEKPVKIDGRKPASWRPNTSITDRRIPLELKNGEILALLGNADPKSVPKPALSSK